MKIQSMLCLVLLMFAASAQGALETLEEAIEAYLSTVELPAHEASRVVIRECSGCDADIYRVNAQTRYQIGAASVTLPDLKLAAAEGGEQSLVYIFYGVDHGFVTRIVLDVAP